MKTRHLFPAVCLAAQSIIGAARADQPEMRDALTNDQLTEMHADAAKRFPTAVHRAREAPDPSKESPPQSIVSQSDFLSFNGKSTMVPKQAILRIPPNLADRIKFTPGNQLMTWRDFYAVNRAWITTVEVSRIQAEGNQALAEETAKQVSKSTSLVVATYKAGPISVLPLKTPPPVDPTKDASKTATATASQKKP